MSLFNFIKFSSTTAGTQRIFPCAFFQTVSRHLNFLFLPSMPTSGMWSKGLPWHPLFTQDTVYQVYNNSSVSTHDNSIIEGIFS